MMAVDARAAQRDVQGTARRVARVGYDRFESRRQYPDDARIAEYAEQIERFVHHGCLFGAAGITPACSIATRAKVVKTGAATTPP